MRALFFSILIASFCTPLSAKPRGMRRIAGKVQLKDQGSHLIIESGKKAIISWDEFSLGKVESIHFAQASEKSSVLNRIRGAKPSEIFGEISSNGSVYLLNPKGIIFGEDCRINVAALVASTLDVLNEDFLRGEDLPFIGDSRARILNLGKMDLGEGEIFLLAREIDQRGELKARYVGLGSSRDILLRPKGEQRIFVKPDVGGSISCEGDIRSAVTEIRSGSPYAKAIRLKGTIEGVVSRQENGRIYLVAEEGRTIVEGKITAPKGEVHLLGDEVVLTDSADVDVSSSSGGGTILVGGDTQGKNPDIFTSTYTMASNEAKLRADAWEHGDGGRIIFWANKSAQIYSDISVRGGEEGGNGGFVEVSGREHFSYCGTSDRSAPKGKAGQLLLDPEADIVISTGGDAGGSFGGTAPITYTPSALASTINTTTLQGELGSGNVLVQTTTLTTVTGAGGGTITVSDPVTWSAANTLELDAAGPIEIGADITSSSTASFTAMDFHNAATITTSNYTGVHVDSSVTLSSSGGEIKLTGIGENDGTVGSTHGVNIDTDATITSVNGKITIDGTGGAGTDDNFGVFIDLGATVEVTGNSDIEIDGNLNGAPPGSSGTQNFGVNINGGPGITTVEVGGTGTITINGQGGNGSSGLGVRLSGNTTANAAAVKVNQGTISITATPGTNTPGAFQMINGALLEDGGFTGNTISVTATSGTMEITGSSEITATNLTLSATAGSGTAKDAILVDTSSITSTVSMAMTGTKTQGTGKGVNLTGATISSPGGTITGTSIEDDGVSVNSSSSISNTNFIGTATGTTTSTSGVQFDGSSFLSSGALSLQIKGTNSATTASDLVGVHLTGSTLTITSGSLAFTGAGGAGTTGCHGISFDSGSSLPISVSGASTLTGSVNASVSGTANFGISLDDSSISTSNNNNLALTGTGGGASSRGISMTDGASLLTTSGADLQLTGKCSAAGGSNVGICLDDAMLSTTSTGRIELSGRSASDGTGGSNHGIVHTGSSVISSSSTASSAGLIRLIGRGGTGTTTNEGILMGSASITSERGAILLTGVGGNGSGSGNDGIQLFGTSPITASNAAPIVLTGTTGTGPGSASGVLISDVGSVVSVENGNLTVVGRATGTGSGQVGVQLASDSTTTSSDTGKVSITGTSKGGGASGHGVYFASGGLVSSTGSGTLTVDGVANGAATSSEGVRIEGNASSITSKSATILVKGRAPDTSITGIRITDSGVISTSASARIELQTFSDVIIDDGGSILGGSSPVIIDSDRDLIITGSSSAGTPSGIFLGTGNGIFTAKRDVQVLGGSGLGSYAQIGSLLDTSARIFFPIVQRSVVVDGVNTNSYALIGHGDPTLPGATLSGDITFGLVLSNISILGADTDGGGGQGFAQIGHIDGIGAALSGNIGMVANNSLTVTGGVATASSYARIGHGGASGGGTFGTSIMNLIFGNNITLDEMTGPAQIVNESTSNLTLVMDNNFPKPPEVGTGSFTQRGTLTAAGGQLRIYTVSRGLNTIANTINGEAFAPTVLPIDNPQEEFRIYFPAGVFSTASFRIYYKVPVRAPFPQNAMHDLTVANAQLQDGLPIFRYMRLPNYPFYHANTCKEMFRGIRCDPGFNPYGSLVFEDNIYWIGEGS